MVENKKFVELLWNEKYDKLKLGEKIPIERSNLQFQIIKTVKNSRIYLGAITTGKW